MLVPEKDPCSRCGGSRVDESATIRGSRLPPPPCPDCVPLDERLRLALEHTARLIPKADTDRLRRRAKA